MSFLFQNLVKFKIQFSFFFLHFKFLKMFGLIYLRYPVQMLVSCPSLAALGTRDIGRMQTKQKNLSVNYAFSNSSSESIEIPNSILPFLDLCC
jgi:hypothetical protein